MSFFFLSFSVLCCHFPLPFKMTKGPHPFYTVVISLTSYISLQAYTDNLQCKRFRSIYGWMLKGHVFQEHNAANILACSLLCNSNIRCQSINYVMGRNLCELNSRTKEARPEDYAQDADRVHLTRPSERGIKYIQISTPQRNHKSTTEQLTKIFYNYFIIKTLLNFINDGGDDK